MAVLFDKSMRVLSPLQLKNLEEYKYVCKNESVVEPVLNKILWTKIMDCLPYWVPPVGITVVGFVFNILTTLVLFYYSPDCTQKVPSWAFVLAALGLFVQQTLDNIDGKQERRVKSNTSLGCITDHGCDSITAAFLMLGVSIASQLGHTPGILLVQNLTAFFLFYLSQWSLYVTGMFRIGKIDVTETQLGLIGIHLLTGMFGQEIWSSQLPGFDLQLRHVPIIIGNLGVLLRSMELSYIMYTQARSSKDKRTVDGTSLMSPLFMIYVVLLFAVFLQYNSPSSVFKNNPCIYIMMFGLLASKATNVLLIAHVTKTEMRYWDNSFLLPCTLLLNQFLNCVVDESILLCICMVLAALDNLKYMAITWREVCDYFQISCFVVPPKDITENNNHEEINSEVKNVGVAKPENESSRILRRAQAKAMSGALNT